MPKFDAEVLAMNRALKLLQPLDPPARARVVQVLHARFVAPAWPELSIPMEPPPPNLPLTCEHGVVLGHECLRCNGVPWDATPAPTGAQP